MADVRLRGARHRGDGARRGSGVGPSQPGLADPARRRRRRDRLGAAARRAGARRAAPDGRHRPGAGRTAGARRRSTLVGPAGGRHRDGAGRAGRGGAGARPVDVAHRSGVDRGAPGARAGRGARGRRDPPARLGAADADPHPETIDRPRCRPAGGRRTCTSPGARAAPMALREHRRLGARHSPARRHRLDRRRRRGPARRRRRGGGRGRPARRRAGRRARGGHPRGVGQCSQVLRVPRPVPVRGGRAGEHDGVRA